LNVPIEEPEETVTDAGTVAAEVRADVNVIVAPPAGATAVSVMVHTELAGAAKETGTHVNPLSPGSIVTVPPVVEVPNPAPDGSAAELFVT
jgi:hypothetical protein